MRPSRVELAMDAFNLKAPSFLGYFPENYLSSYPPEKEPDGFLVHRIMTSILDDTLSDHLEKILPDYKSLNRDEVIAYLQVAYTFSNTGEDSVYKEICTIFPLLFVICGNIYNLKDLISFIIRCRTIYTAPEYSNIDENLEFTNIISPHLYPLYPEKEDKSWTPTPKETEWSFEVV